MNLRDDLVLEVRDLVVEFLSEDGPLRAVDSVSFSIGRGEIVGLVGESGAGKTLTSEAILGLIRCPPGRVSGEVRFRGQNLLGLDEGALSRIRGKEIAMIFQNPGASLNPVIRVGHQLTEAMALHLDEGRSTLRRRAIEVLTRVGIPSAATRVRDYPHQFSGGMAQRVMIGMGVSCVPGLLIADEPTTALDVTIQAQVLALIRQLAREMGMAVLLVSHDLGIVSQMCHRVIVMYAGRIVEEAPIATVFRAPAHPYTQALIACLPGLDGHGRLGAIPGVMPGLKAVPTGCRFHPRCAVAEPRCAVEEPALRRAGPDQIAACHLVSAPR
ncbi:MAG TPA: ABC transporter ATP-binding protein [Methylomirabilota bacterium]|jgi:oligopeptide/dipeptide ABC transporter ATP-binding protein|nr:ABC transporter ATP-binding protein [Methylomirabilota bacterium]